MNIVVCMKAVPSTNQVLVDGQYKLQRDGAKLTWNIADESALECALQLKGEQDTVTVITMGPAKLSESMPELFARGADHCILITDSAFAGSDTFATAKVLAKAIQTIPCSDLILCGRRAIDGETGQVPGMLSAALSLPCITNADRLAINGNILQVNRRLETGTQVLRTPFPAIVSLCEYTYDLRLPGIMAMRRAKSKTVQIFSLKELDMEPGECGLKGSLTKVISMDSKFPGLRKGPKETDIKAGIEAIVPILKGVE